MPKVIQAKLDGQEMRTAIVISRFNEFITSKLLKGALDALYQHNVAKDNIDIIWVPGSLEIPLAVKKIVEKGTYNSIICLGCVMRGATQHHALVGSETAKQIVKSTLDYNIPLGFGIVSVDSIEQAIERAGTKMGNRGYEAALAALEMANLQKQLDY